MDYKDLHRLKKNALNEFLIQIVWGIGWLIVARPVLTYNILSDSPKKTGHVVKMNNNLLTSFLQ